MVTWNPWHGCTKLSEGCMNCYVYRSDARYGKDASVVKQTSSFNLPIRKKRYGEFVVKPNSTINTCFTSDFFLDQADDWRQECWGMIKVRHDCKFFFITKRIHRYKSCFPSDWSVGYPHVTIGVTVENQAMVDFRLPYLIEAPIVQKLIIVEPILGSINLQPYLVSSISGVVVGGESGPDARLCDYDWVLNIKNQCEKAQVPFMFRQTGALFKKDNKIYRIARMHQGQQARKADIDSDFPVL